MYKTLNLRHLLAALEVARHGSISGAARVIHLSQPSLTQAISKLERALDAQLFERTATGVMPTVEGKVFMRRLERSQRWLQAIENYFVARSSRSKIRIERQFSSRQLRALIAVVEAGSYTQAAKQLQLSQPTLHKSIHDLETLFGQALFQRAPQGVEPSWKARQVARYANLFFAELNQGIDELNEQRGVMNGAVSIGALPLSRTRLVPLAVTELLSQFPQARVQIIDGPYTEQLHALLHGQIDCIVGALRDPLPSPDIVQEALFTDLLSVVVRREHALARRKNLGAETLRTLSWIAPRQGTPARLAFTAFFESKGLQAPEHVIECSSLIAIRSLLLNSDRAALLPARQVEMEVASGLLAVCPMSLEGTAREIGITLRKDWHPTVVQEAFLQTLRLIASEL